VRAISLHFVPKIGRLPKMLDRFDIALLNIVQRDDGRTAESLAEEVALSPSAIARRLRRLRADGIIARTIALLSPRLVDRGCVQSFSSSSANMPT
jgi:DNA-binding Lrp family transcriptional regulator